LKVIPGILYFKWRTQHQPVDQELVVVFVEDLGEEDVEEEEAVVVGEDVAKMMKRRYLLHIFYFRLYRFLHPFKKYTFLRLAVNFLRIFSLICS